MRHIQSGGMLENPFGIIGSEIAFSLLYTFFSRTRHSNTNLIGQLLTFKPVPVFGLATWCA